MASFSVEKDMIWRRRRSLPLLLLVHFIVLSSFPATCAALDDDDSGAPNSASSEASAKIEEKSNKDGPPILEEDWGSFYDPKGVFCGEYDCYKILGFDYEQWGRNPPSLKDITKSYRTLSRAWHPDKNKRDGAKERFVKIAKAYEILTDVEKRKEYDYLRERPDEYFLKYGSSVLWSYAPQSDVRFILFLFAVLGSAFTYFAQKQKWQTVADHLVKAAVEGWGTREGGSTESIELRERALEILAEQREKETANSAAANGGASSKKKGPKLTAKEKRAKEQDALRPIIVDLVKEMKDFGGGFHQPTIHDLLVVKLCKAPLLITRGLLWRLKYMFRRLRKLELNDEEREANTRLAVGEVAWAAASDEERKEMVTLDLWETKNLEDWRERQEMKTLSAGYQKRFARLKKKQGSKLE